MLHLTVRPCRLLKDPTPTSCLKETPGAGVGRLLLVIPASVAAKLLPSSQPPFRPPAPTAAAGRGAASVFCPVRWPHNR